MRAFSFLDVSCYGLCLAAMFLSVYMYLQYCFLDLSIQHKCWSVFSIPQFSSAIILDRSSELSPLPTPSLSALLWAKLQHVGGEFLCSHISLYISSLNSQSICIVHLSQHQPLSFMKIYAKVFHRSTLTNILTMYRHLYSVSETQKNCISISKKYLALLELGSSYTSSTANWCRVRYRSVSAAASSPQFELLSHSFGLCASSEGVCVMGKDTS